MRPGFILKKEYKQQIEIDCANEEGWDGLNDSLGTLSFLIK